MQVAIWQPKHIEKWMLGTSPRKVSEPKASCAEQHMTARTRSIVHIRMADQFRQQTTRQPNPSMLQLARKVYVKEWWTRRSVSHTFQNAGANHNVIHSFSKLREMTLPNARCESLSQRCRLQISTFSACGSRSASWHYCSEQQRHAVLSIIERMDYLREASWILCLWSRRVTPPNVQTTT